MSFGGGNNLTSAIGTLALTKLQAGTYTRSAPADKTGTISTTGVMDGLAISFTPSKSGKVNVLMFCRVANSVTGDGNAVDLRFGTGAAPANGDALTGTVFEPLVSIATTAYGYTGTTTNEKYPIFLFGFAALTADTAYWIDMGFKAVTGGTATITETQALIIENTN